MAEQFGVINAVARALRRGGAGADGERPLRTNERDELLVAQGMAPYLEVSRQRDVWTAQTATLFAPIAAYPSTTARLELFNNHQRKVMVILDVFMAQVLATDADEAWCNFAMVSTKKAAPTNTALTVASCSGLPAWTTTAAGPLLTGVDTTVVANGWRPWGNGIGFGNAAATPGSAQSAPVDGKLIVPPGCSLCIAPAGAIATASSFQCGATFFWADITVEG